MSQKKFVAKVIRGNLAAPRLQLFAIPPGIKGARFIHRVVGFSPYRIAFFRGSKSALRNNYFSSSTSFSLALLISSIFLISPSVSF
jgi:hypothetical protein